VREKKNLHNGVTKKILKKSFYNKKNLLFALNAKRIFLYGASSSGVVALNALFSIGIKNIYFLDSDKKKIGKHIFGIKVINIKNVKKNDFIIISSVMFKEIKKFLKEKSFTNYHYYQDLIFNNFIEYKFNNKFIKIYNYLFNKEKILLTIDEAYTLYSQLNRVCFSKKSINCAEVGTYKGGSAYLISSIIKNNEKNKIFIYDTFQGLPEDRDPNNKFIPKSGWLNDTSSRKVKNFLLNSGIKESNLFIREGIFPNSVNKYDHQKKFSFVHLDTDLFKSTYDSLVFFYNRLENGGIIISHDYNSYGCTGVKNAFIKFCNQKKIFHKLHIISKSQCMLFG
jgi:hypothetical protein